jgi:S1-C subfamily serine protease
MLTSFFKTAKVLRLAICLAVFFSAAGFGADSSLYSLETALNDLIYRLSESVVTVEASKSVSFNSTDGSEESVHSLVSSGIVYDSLGHVLVAASSVVGRGRIMVFQNNRAIPAALIGVDYQTGLALLELGTRIGTPIRPAGQYLCAGQMVVAIGNAYGLPASPSLGFCAGIRPEGTIQFTSPITAGTIGGGVFDLSGQLVGIISGSLGEGPQTGAGLAVPADQLPGIVQYLLQRGNRPAGFIGLTTAEIEITPGIELPSDIGFASTGDGARRYIDQGLIVTGVTPATPAAKAGLVKGDLLFSFNRKDIVSAFDMKKSIIEARPGTRVEFGFIRHNKPYYIQVEIAPMEASTMGTAFPDYGEQADTRQTADALLRELSALRRTIIRLERQVDALR